MFNILSARRLTFEPSTTPQVALRSLGFKVYFNPNEHNADIETCDGLLNMLECPGYKELWV